MYTVRLTTSYRRGAALSDPPSGINICMVNSEGAAVIHRIKPVTDPSSSHDDLDELCQVSSRYASLTGAVLAHVSAVSIASRDAGR